MDPYPLLGSCSQAAWCSCHGCAELGRRTLCLWESRRKEELVRCWCPSPPRIPAALDLPSGLPSLSRLLSPIGLSHSHPPIFFSCVAKTFDHPTDRRGAHSLAKQLEEVVGSLLVAERWASVQILFKLLHPALTELALLKIGRAHV